MAQVYDGDTVRLRDGRRVRLLNVNAPEIAHGAQPGQPHGQEAARALRKLLPDGAAVGLSYDADREDKYGRLLAHLALTDGTDAQAALLAQGAAWVLVVPPNVARVDCYARIERQARSARRGLWALADYGPQALVAPGFRFIESQVTRTGRSSRGQWFELAAGATVYVDTPDLRYFEPGFLEHMQGKKVRVRGQVHETPGGPALRVRHPAVMEIVP